MATTITHTKSSRRVFSKILQRLLRGTAYITAADGSLHSLRLRRWQKRVWIASTGTPSVAMADSELYPVKLGELCYVEDVDHAYICDVAVAPATDATFIKMHA